MKPKVRGTSIVCVVSLLRSCEKVIKKLFYNRGDGQPSLSVLLIASGQN